MGYESQSSYTNLEGARSGAGKKKNKNDLQEPGVESQAFLGGAGAGRKRLSGFGSRIFLEGVSAESC